MEHAPKRRRRGRPRRDEGPAVTREAIVARALEAAAANGAAGLGLRDLARRLGVSLATIQRFFPTKDDLWRACVDAVVDEIPLAAGVDVGAAPGGGELVRTHLRHQIERAVLLPAITAAMWQDASPGAEARLAYLTARTRPLVERATRLLDAAVSAGVARPVAPEAFLGLLVLGVTSLATSQEALRRLFDVDLVDPAARARLADALADLLLHGLLEERRA